MGRRGNKDDLNNPDIRKKVLAYILKEGVIAGAWLLAGVGKTTFSNYLKENPDFRAEVDDAIKFSDPAVFPKFRKKAVTALDNILTHGAFRKISEPNPETGKNELKRLIETGVPRWAIERIMFPDRPVESALNMVIASEQVALTESTDFTDAEKKRFFKFLLDFKRKELIELINHGIPVREDVE